MNDTVQKSIQLYKGNIHHRWIFDGSAEQSNTYRGLIKSTNGRVDLPKVDINPKKDLLLLPYSSGTTGMY